MFSLDFIFISITLIILLFISFKIGSPKVAIPLILIYFFLIVNTILNFSGQGKSSLIVEDKPGLDPIQQDAEVNKKTQNLIEQNDFPKNTESQQKLKINQTKNVVLEIKDKEIEEKKVLKIKKNDQLTVQTSKKETIDKKELIDKKKTIDKKKKESLDNLLSLKEIKICKNIKNRNPVGVGDIFPNSVDSLYCFTKIANLGKKMEVRHVWYYENQIMTQVRYNVKKSNVYRSWTKKTISSFQIGNWRVEVQDRNGTIIGSKRFKIKKSS